jgi:hypothetical protein
MDEPSSGEAGEDVRLSRTTRARRRPIRLGLPLLLLSISALAAAALQVYVPRVAAGAIRSAVAENLHTTAQVAVQGPFWQLAQGGFQALSLQVGPSLYGGYRLQSASLNWRGGRVDLQDLLAGRLKVLRSGRLRLRLVMTETALAAAVAASLRQAMPQTAAGSMPTIVVSPQRITLRGRITFLGMPVRYTVDGNLVLQQKGDVLAFQAHDFNDSTLHLPPLPVLRMQDLGHVPGMPLHIAGVQLMPGALAILLAGPN